MTSIRPLGSDKATPEKSSSERYAADRRGPERPPTEKIFPERPASERLSPERQIPERQTPERLGDIDQAAANAFEGEIREFVRRDVNAARKAAPNEPASDPMSLSHSVGDPVADNLNDLIRRVSGASMGEIDRVMAELQSVRDMLRKEGERVSREVAGYASLSHAAMTAMSVIADSLTQWKGEPPKPRPAEPNPGQRSVV